MMKRILSAMLGLLLLSAAALAESDPYLAVLDTVYRIVLRTEAGDVTLGSGVLYGQADQLLTAESCCRAGELFAIGEDGEHAVLSYAMVKDTGAALITLATPAAAQPMALAAYDTPSLPFIFGANVRDELSVAPLYQVLHAVYRDHKALQISGTEGLLPGAVVVDERGQIVALTVAAHTEGLGMYTALEPDVLGAAIQGKTSPFLPVEAAWNGGLLTLSWKDVVRTGGAYLLTVTGAENNYYTNYETKEKSFQLAVPAGHSYYYQVQWVDSGASPQPLVWEDMSAYTVPELPLPTPGYQQQCYLASAPRGKEFTSVLPEMPLISVDTLFAADQERYLQIISSYDVTEALRCPMTVSLIAPDGQFYYEEMFITLTPEEEEQDVFAVPVDSIFAGCRDFSGGGSLMTGNYELRVHLAGKLAGSYSFTVLPAGTALPEPTATPAPAETGFVQGLAVTREKGLVTLDWSGCVIPEGKTVTAYILYDGNTYYTYKEMTAGTTSADFPEIPGVGCMVWAAYSGGGTPNLVPTSHQECTVLAAQAKTAFTLNGFTHVRDGLAFTDDPQAAEGTVFLPEAPVTRELLAGEGFILFQTEDTYAVSELSEDHILSIVLHTPEGMHFMTSGGYTFDPTLTASDLWLLDITGLFDSYESMAPAEPWPAGDYTIGYYIDGQVVSETTFTLE